MQRHTTQRIFMLCRSFTHEMRSASIRQRFLLWTTLAVILHGLLYLMLAHALEPLDHLLGWPVWFPLFRSTALTIVPALLVGLLIGYQKARLQTPCYHSTWRSCVLGVYLAVLQIAVVHDQHLL